MYARTRAPRRRDGLSAPSGDFYRVESAWKFSTKTVLRVIDGRNSAAGRYYPRINTSRVKRVPLEVRLKDTSWLARIIDPRRALYLSTFPRPSSLDPRGRR